MSVPRLSNKEFIEHLRRHPMPEFMDEKCLAALDNIEEQFGNILSTNVILEVRVGAATKYVDYVFVGDTNKMPLPSDLWYELDYEQFASGKEIKPCYFFSIFKPPASLDEYTKIFDESLPPFLGEERARKLRPLLDNLVAVLFGKAYIRHLGTMSGRGELDKMRLVISFADAKNLRETLKAIGWKGEVETLWELIAPWLEKKGISVGFDLSEKGISDKLGLEVEILGEHPVLVDIAISRLERAGLCLKSKGDALRRWIRIPPDAAPPIQTRIQYFKLNYLDGKITEAKVYLEQSPHFLHWHFKNYDRPLYVEFMLKDGENTLPIGTAMKCLYDCEDNRVRQIHFLGDVAGYEHLDRLLAECKEEGLLTSIEISGKITRKQLKDMIAEGANEFMVAIENESALKMLQEFGFADVRAKWFMDGENFRDLKQKVELAKSLGVKEFIITGMKPHDVKKSAPSREALEQTTNFINDYEKTSAEMKLSVEPCFSILRAFMGGADPKKNPNRGINRGCTAGRDHFCITASGNFSPCSFIPAEKATSIADYWEKSPALEKLRAMEENRPSPCKGCRYERRCLPCPSFQEKIFDCPISK